MHGNPETRVKSFKALAPLAIAALVAGGCASSSTQSAPRRAATAADPQITRELAGAVDAMRATRSYRFVATVQTDKEATVARGEFQAPDRVHQTITVGDRPAAELVINGARVAVRDPRTGAWRDRQRGAAAASDPRAAFTTLSQARDVRKDGQTYRFTLSTDAAAALVRGTQVSKGAITGTVVLAGGRISSLDYSVTGKGRTVHVSIVYSEFDAAPPVVVPV
jgi:outer membrane lipoprotein-sorting protein